MKLREAIGDNLPAEVKGLMIKKSHVDKHDDDSRDEWGEGPTKTVHYDIINKNKKKVGEMQQSDYFSQVFGTLWGRPLPDISNYLGKQDWAKSGVQGNFHRFFKTKTGMKWLDVARRQGKIS